jgi:hypothetical protein
MQRYRRGLDRPAGTAGSKRHIFLEEAAMEAAIFPVKNDRIEKQRCIISENIRQEE